MTTVRKGESVLLQHLLEEVLEANLSLPRHDMVKFTWGNVSGIDRDEGLVVIKPSGVPYERLTLNDMVVLTLEGTRVQGELNPSTDTPTHLYLYQTFSDIGGIVHTHSPWATSFAQAGRPIPAFGTTHADYFYGEIPCTRPMTDEEIATEYELETGRVIAEALGDVNPLHMPGVLVHAHAPFCWGKDAHNAVHNAVVLEEVAKIALHSVMLNPGLGAINPALLDKHFLRKHGKNAYYGQ